MVEMIEPHGGKVFDPACGSGGMFVQSVHFIEEHRKELKQSDSGVYVYGQEKQLETVNLAKMNLAVNGLRGEIKKANTYYDDPFDSFGAFDYVLANPPFNVDDVSLSSVEKDRRFNAYGIPRKKTKGKKKDKGKEPVPNANYLWIGLFATSLKPRGRAALVMANSASDARHSEAAIRQKLIEENLIYAVLTLPSNMFYTVTLPATLWFFDKDKADDRILFIDVRNVFTQIDRAHREFSDEQIKNIAIISQLHKGPLFYQKRVPQVLIQNEDLDDEFAEILEDENLDDAQETKLENRFAKEIEVIKREDRLETIAEDIVYHFPRRGYLGKGMVVSLDKFTAVKMYDKVERLWKEQIKELRGAIRKSTDPDEKNRLQEQLDYMRSVEMAVIVSEEGEEEKKFAKQKLNIRPHRERMVDAIIEQKDLDTVAIRVGQLLDESLVVDGKLDGKPEFRITQSGKTWDLSRINFEKLKEDFKRAKYKNIEIADLRAFINHKLEQMLKQNSTRTAFATRLQGIIDAYNAGSSSADNYFEELVKFTKNLKEESERHIREGLTEDELELFDLLKKSKMTHEETQKVRLAAKSLLHRLREESPNVLVTDWYKDVQSKSRVRSAVESVLDATLPESYNRAVFTEKCNSVFDLMVDYASQGVKWAM
jgi:hypothetical protein